MQDDRYGMLNTRYGLFIKLLLFYQTKEGEMFVETDNARTVGKY